jgi:hypothetical protein
MMANGPLQPKYCTLQLSACITAAKRLQPQTDASKCGNMRK